MSIETETTPTPGGSLGTRDLVVLVIATAVPLSSAAGLMPVAIGYGTGIGTPGAWLCASLVLVAFTVGWTRMSRHVTNGGAFYAYIARGLGRPPGLAGAFVAVVAYNAMQIASLGLLGFFAQAAASTLLGVDLPWWVWAFLGLLVIAGLASRAIDLSARLLLAVVAVELVMLAGVVVAVLVTDGPSSYPLQSFAPSTVLVGGLGVTVAMAVMASLGFEAAAVYGPEARRPRRTVPRATYIAIVAMALVYVVVCWSLIAAVGPDAKGIAAADPQGFFFSVASSHLGAVASAAMETWVVFGILGTCIASHYLAARYFFILGREGILPTVLGRTRPGTQVPWWASLLQLGLATVVLAGAAAAGVDPYVQLGTGLFALSVLGLAVLMATASIAVVRFFRTEERGHPVPTLVMPLVSLVGLLLIVGAVLSNYDTLSGTTTGLLPLLPWLIVIAAVYGIARAWWLRRTNPSRYARLGDIGQEHEATAEPPPVPAQPALQFPERSTE